MAVATRRQLSPGPRLLRLRRLGKRRGEEDVLFYDELKAALNDLFQTLLHKLMTAEIRVNHFDIDMSEVGG